MEGSQLPATPRRDRSVGRQEDLGSTVTEIAIEGRRRQPVRQALTELLSYRGTVLAFAERNVRVKYKQAALGVAWAVIQPLAFMAIFTFALGHLAKVSGGGVPYA